MQLVIRRLGAAAVAVCPLLLGAAHAAPSVPATAFVSPAASTASVTFEVFLPLRNTAALDTLLEDLQNPASPNYKHWLTPAQFGAKFGPTADSMARATAALKAQGFTVTAVHTRSVQVAGTAGAVAKTFAISLTSVQPRTGPARMMASTALTLPAALKAEGATIVSFAGRPALRPTSRVTALAQSPSPDNRYAPYGGYWYTDLKQAYDYPSYVPPTGATTADGAGVTVAVLMSSDALDSDLALMFTHEHFTANANVPPPKITHVAIDGGAPTGSDAFAEASLDVQQVLGGAPGANVTLVNIPDLSDENIIAGYLYIVETNQFAIVNSSFGGCELAYSAAYNGGQDFNGILDTYDTLFKQGNAQGVTFVASSGDEGGLECPSLGYFNAPAQAARFIPSVSFPADSPHVTAVGGTNLITTYNPPTLTSTYVGENALGDPEYPYDPYGFGAGVSGGYWGAGGGVSAHFAKPSYQSAVATGSTTMRTVPDVGMHVGGCPGGIGQSPCGPNRSYVLTYIGGSLYGLIGTSVSSPEFVSAVALYDQKTGHRAGNLNTFLYAQSAAQNAGKGVFYHRNIPGFDGKWTDKFPAGGYDYLVGNGTPDVRALFGLTSYGLAGDPKTPTNP